MPDELSVSHSRVNACLRAYAHHHSSTTDASTATQDLCAVTLYAVATPSISGFIRSTDNADSEIEPKNKRIYDDRPHRRYNPRKLSPSRFYKVVSIWPIEVGQFNG